MSDGDTSESSPPGTPLHLPSSGPCSPRTAEAIIENAKKSRRVHWAAECENVITYEADEEEELEKAETWAAIKRRRQETQMLQRAARLARVSR